MKLLAHYRNDSLRSIGGEQIWNDLTGYVDPETNSEYIIAGSIDSIYFFDITVPSSMKLVDVEAGKSFFAQNRDYFTYKHYAYCVSDRASGIGGLQIFDLQYLPDSVHKVYESNALGTFTHTIFIDTIKARMYMCSNTKTPQPFSAMDIISLKNPEQPELAATLKVPLKSDGTPLFTLVHEMYLRNDTAYLSCGYDGLFIFDLRDLAKQQFLSAITAYPDQDFNHSSWLDNSGKYLMFTDEKMGMDVKIYDISKIADPRFVSQFNSNTLATPHNAYLSGNLAYISAYQDGVRVFDIKNPLNPVQVAWYDTHPDSPENYNGFKGCWGVYPFLPSKHIIASDISNGIFVFEMDSSLVGVSKTFFSDPSVLIYPNPFTGKLKIECSMFKNELLDFKLYNTNGQLLLHNSITEPIFEVDLSELNNGIYYIHFGAERINQFKKIIKAN
ncbi:MAG: choice-of-anchor B family protein [Bacteroidia bacterium]|nr:choice-of-anchor B family protein [Bacteroidia bacterium]